MTTGPSTTFHPHQPYTLNPPSLLTKIHQTLPLLLTQSQTHITVAKPPRRLLHIKHAPTTTPPNNNNNTQQQTGVRFNKNYIETANKKIEIETGKIVAQKDNEEENENGYTEWIEEKEMKTGIEWPKLPSIEQIEEKRERKSAVWINKERRVQVW